VIVLGLANLLADGLAMGAGNYLGMRSEQEYQHSVAGVARSTSSFGTYSRSGAAASAAPRCATAR